MDTSTEKPIRRRKGRGARERILATAVRLFTAQGINATGMEQLSAEAEVTKRTVYAHFASKEALVEAYLERMDHAVRAAEATLEDPDVPARERLLSIFDAMLLTQPQCADGAAARGCPFLNAAVEVPDPAHPVHVFATAQKAASAKRLADVAGAAGARDPDKLGEQLALLYDGAAARSVALNSADTIGTGREIAALLVDAALPAPRR
jgi:AcrR family transcriptional regulator